MPNILSCPACAAVVMPQETGDVCPSEFAGSRILIERSETYVTECIRTLGIRPTSRSPFATERGVREVTGSSR